MPARGIVEFVGGASTTVPLDGCAPRPLGPRPGVLRHQTPEPGEYDDGLVCEWDLYVLDGSKERGQPRYTYEGREINGPR